MNQQIQQGLSHIFNRDCIVFWDDTKKELADEFEALAAGAAGGEGV